MTIDAITDEVHELAKDLVHTMRHGPRPAIGLSAPQVGASVRMSVMEEELGGGRQKIYVFVNPEVIRRSGRMAFREGCLSFPDRSFVRTERDERIEISWTDLSGARRKKEFRGMLAVCVQHELDHLDGRLMVDIGELESLDDPPSGMAR